MYVRVFLSMQLQTQLMRVAKKDITVTSKGRSFTVPKGHIVATSPYQTMRLPHLFKNPDKVSGQGQQQHQLNKTTNDVMRLDMHNHGPAWGQVWFPQAVTRNLPPLCVVVFVARRGLFSSSAVDVLSFT